MNEVIQNLKEKKILILGFAREGQSTYKFLRKYFPRQEIAISDQKEFEDWENKAKELVKKDKNVVIISGDGYLESLTKYDTVFKSPGIPNKLPQIKEAKEKGINFTSQTKLFFDLCKGVIIGVTGTKGKSTTTSLVHHILKTAGKDAILLGNIGKPCLDYLDSKFGKSKYFCFEMSSHQLSDIHKSPHIAILLNVFREHLDYYEDFQDYINAKARVTIYQGKDDFFIYNRDFEEIRKIAQKTKAKKLPFSIRQKKYRIDTLLPGKHNLNNITAATLAAKVLNIPPTLVSKAVKSFKPLEQRLQVIGKFRGITFVDDSLSTIPEATIAAIEAYSSRIGSLILGGTDRGQNFGGLVKVILNEKIRTIILFPTTGDRILKEINKLAKTSLPKCFGVGNMKDAVRLSYENTPKGKICLMSCASPSFGMFKDYKDRGKQFKKFVKMIYYL